MSERRSLLRRPLTLALVAGTLAIGAPVAAVAAAGGGDDGGERAPSAPAQTVQDEGGTQRDRDRDGRDCPRKDGSGGSGSDTTLRY